MASAEDLTELEVLTRKPVCFVILGKPGSGKTTLALHLSRVWKCQLINAITTLEEAIQEKTCLGQKAEICLKNGEELDEIFVAQVISEKIDSSDISHYGYILDCFPSAVETWKSFDKQLEFIRTLRLNPDVIINLKIPDQDLQTRRSEQYVDVINNKSYGRVMQDPKSKLQSNIVLSSEVDTEESEDYVSDDQKFKDQNNDINESGDFFEDDLALVEDTLDSSEVAVDQLVKARENLQPFLQSQVQYYNENMLVKIEDFIISHTQQHVIELDANLPPKDLLKSLLIRLNFLGLPRCPAPRILVDPEEEEEPGIADELFLQQLSEINNVLPKFRWRHSRWGRLCPVELTQGNMVPGKMEFAVGFLDKMYSMSSPEALKQFLRNPRQFLLPPHPINPCKVCVVGPPLSGKSTLAKRIAKKYNAVVLVMTELIEPISKRALEVALEEAKIEAENTAIDTISAQQAHKGDPEQVQEVTSDHPDVVKAVNAAVEMARAIPFEYTQDMYIEALRAGVKKAEKIRREIDLDGPRFGGWVLDGFPETRENWAAMIENNLLPDYVLSIEDDQAPPDFLLTRYTTTIGLPDPATLKTIAKQEQENEQSAPLPLEVVQWQKKRSDYDKRWSQLFASMKGSAIDPLGIDCCLSEDRMEVSAIALMEAVFEYKALEYSPLEEDADADDDPTLNPDEVEEGSEEHEEEVLKRKAWGLSKHYCPVALIDKGVLWPGSQDTSARYRERLYFFNSEESKKKFMSHSLRYTSELEHLKLPPLRVVILGPRASGKTIVSRKAAKQLGVFHISFSEHLQEEILPKMKKPPLIDEDDWEKNNEEKKDNEKDEDDLDDDVLMKLTDEETEIKEYLINGDALSEELIEKFASKFWYKEPYRSSGFLLEGFPNSVENLRFLASKGLFADCVVLLQVEQKEVVDRLLPNKVDIWQRKKKKRLEKKAQNKERETKEWETDKAQRKAELKEEYDAKVSTKHTDIEDDDGDEAVDEDLEEYEQRLAEIDQEEFPNDEDEDNEEEETDAKERLRIAILDKCEEEMESILNIQDVFQELQVPVHTVNASRTISVVCYSFTKVISPYTKDRQGLLSKCTRIDGDMAKTLLDHGYKQLSKFKMWCPVKDSEGILPLYQPFKKQMFPVIYKQQIYFLSSLANTEQFITNPTKFVALKPPECPVPMRVSVVGPPKSGKSTVAKRFTSEYGCVHLSIGGALRLLIKRFPESKLTKLILSCLKTGQTVPDDLCVYALERALLDVQCSTRGYVMDGWPVTMAQVDLLTKFRIIPVCIVEVENTKEEMLRRSNIDRLSPHRAEPLPDNPSILAIRSSYYQKNIASIKEWYSKNHSNWYVVNGGRSSWWMWNEVNHHALKCSKQIQHYLNRIVAGQATSIAGLCITPQEFRSNLGEYAQYCPVSLTCRNELVDCSGFESLSFAVEYRNKYYKMSSQSDLEEFLKNADLFVGPKAFHLPSSKLLPRRRSRVDVKSSFPKQLEIQRICPVTYVEGQKRYESIVPGNLDLVAEYNSKLYCFSSEENREKFMRQPFKYEVTSLPTKLPPLTQPLSITSLPMLGYLEQSVAVSVINALSAVGVMKPKLPFLTSTNSALFYVACHLKAFNPKSKDYIRTKFKNKQVFIEEMCKLTTYLSSCMKLGYSEPLERPLDFDPKISTFLSLRDTYDHNNSL